MSQKITNIHVHNFPCIPKVAQLSKLLQNPNTMIDQIARVVIMLAKCQSLDQTPSPMVDDFVGRNCNHRVLRLTQNILIQMVHPIVRIEIAMTKCQN